MFKILIIFFLLIQLNAKENIIAELISIPSNSLQIFKIKSQHLQCSSYGVLTLGEILLYKKINLVCKKKINTYFLHHQKMLSFTHRKLNIRAFYTLVLKKNHKCILYAKGQKSLSELLLENGLAIIRTNFYNDEFKYEFLEAQNYAKYHKLGIWSNNTLTICALGLYK